MINAIHRKKLTLFLVSALVMTGMTFSLIGAVSSHGVGVLNESVSVHQHDHLHSQSDIDKKTHHHSFYDSGNHNHESAGGVEIHLVSDFLIPLRQPIRYSGDYDSTLRNRLYRPPKYGLIV